MNPKKQLSLYGLKWNPFTSDLPAEALIETEAASRFAWKVENLVMDGGFAMITGDPGTGKSVILLQLNERLKSMRDVRVACLTRPQSTLADFYRELGSLFDVDLKTSNRYGGYRSLREKWRLHIESTLLRPVLRTPSECSVQKRCVDLHQLFAGPKPQLLVTSALTFAASAKSK